MIAEPYLTYKFTVMIEGLVVAGFTEVSAISVETELDRGRAGGMNQSEYVLVGPTKYSDVTLKQGMAVSHELFTWYSNVIEGRGLRSNIHITLQDSLNVPRAMWTLLEAIPIKWGSPALKASSSEIAIAEITFAHNGILRQLL
jgi:phage tail-like protein